MMVTIHGRVGRFDDPMFRDGDDAITVMVNERDLAAKLVRWTGMGRVITRVTTELHGSETDTGVHDAPSDEQIAEIRALSAGGSYRVSIEKFRSNGDVIVKRRGRFTLIMRDGTVVADDRI